jgi:hypothetical protein
MNKTDITFTLFYFFFGVAAFLLWLCNEPEPKLAPPPSKVVEAAQDTAGVINDSVVRAYAVLVGIPDREIEMVVKLARCESGNYKSRICRENHSLFGMKLPGKFSRHTTATGEKNGYAVYDTYLMSTADLKLYGDRYGYSLRGYSAV